ncbi:bifunctional uridylate/adenylate kinase [Lithohypha guttulata]|uniref:bifunctional uridylate/adenylate kinase n=1 Tax=Lithohypha guttulata TaxID=1690604 RepID=UPI002DE05231|nr:hypothetical protein LTR51_007465 [Lithohypha guttulata]
MATIPNLVYVIGCPGAGKGNLCSKVAPELGWAHLSVGDELRRYVKTHSGDTAIADCVQQTKLVPVEKLAEIMERLLRAFKNKGYHAVILDGFPRRADQIALFDSKFGTPSHVFFMDCPEELAKQRVLERQVLGRMDTAEVFERRHAEFCTNNPEIVRHYEAQEKLIKIDTTRPIEVSYSEIFAVLSRLSLFRNVTSVYLIGVSATGKTTLTGDLAKHFQEHEPERRVAIISEVARELVLSSGVKPEQIRAGEENAMKLQKQILETQLERENEARTKADLILSDRFGIDPVVFAMKYGSEQKSRALLDSDAWKVLRERMTRSLVILCEPVMEWFAEDLVRVVPESSKEVYEVHDTFCEILQAQGISFMLLKRSILERQERVDLVLKFLQMEEPHAPKTAALL